MKFLSLTKLKSITKSKIKIPSEDSIHALTILLKNRSSIFISKGCMVSLKETIVRRWVVIGLFMKSISKIRQSKLNRSEAKEMFIEDNISHVCNRQRAWRKGYIVNGH